MPDTSVKLQDITPVKSTFDNDDQLLLINPTGEARISKEDFLDAMPDDAITLIGDITTTGIEGDTVAEQLGALENSKAPVITDTATGVIANFPDGADNMPVVDLVANIEPVQDLSNGDPSPSNICPISGHTEVTVTRAGKNLLSTNELTLGTPSNTTYSNATKRTFTVGTYITGLSVSNYYNVRTSSISVSDNNISFTTSASAYGIAIPLVGFPVGEKITISATKTNGNVGLSFYKQDGTYISGAKSTANHNYYTQVIPAETFYTIAIFDAQSNNVEATFTNIMIEVGTASAYEPYIAPTTIAIPWQTEAGTVFGGTIDVATGLLTVNRATLTLDGSETITISNSGTANWFYSFSSILTNAEAKNSASDISSAYPRVGITNGNTVQGITAANDWVRVRYGTEDTVANYKAWLASNPVQLCYELKTPQTYQLTPQEVKTLLGTNNVWTDIGNVSVTYPADTKMFIEKLTIPTEDDMVANQAITSGKYFMIGNSLYLALANIASGAQITIGTNAQRVSLADALNTINS